MKRLVHEFWQLAQSPALHRAVLTLLILGIDPTFTNCG